MAKNELSQWARLTTSYFMLYTPPEAAIDGLFQQGGQIAVKEERTVRVSLNNLPKNTQTDWERVKNMTEADINAAAASDPDAQPTDEAFWKDAHVVMPQPKRAISMRVDSDVLAWFKSQGRGYQTRINAVLRSYMEAHRYEDKSATNATVIAETSNQPDASKEA